MSMQLFAGIGRANITPPVGVDLVGTSRRWRPSSGIHQDLHATCLVLSTDNEKLALVDCDLLAIPDPTAGELRRRLGQVMGVPANHVLLGCTHTHQAPPTSPHMPKIGGDQTQLRDVEQAYLANLGYQLESAAHLAMLNLTPARLAAGSGQIDIVINRREQLEDGEVIVGRNIDRPRDPEVGVLRVDTLDGTPLAAVINFACHPVTIGPQACHLISPDFPGSVRRVIEDLTGATALYFTGAAGDIMPLRVVQPDPTVAEIVGCQVGCEAVRVFLGLSSQPTETRRIVLQSLSKYSFYEEVPIQQPPITHFGVVTRQLELDLQPLPSVEEAEHVLEEQRRHIRQLQANDAARDELNPVISQELWARKLVETLRAGTAPRTMRAEIQAIRLNDVALVAVPGEPFVEIGLAVKNRSPIKHTFFIGYANGSIGYIPMREDYALGGYEVEIAYKGYGFPSALAPGTAELVVETCLDLLRELAGPDEVRNG